MPLLRPGFPCLADVPLETERSLTRFLEGAMPTIRVRKRKDGSKRFHVSVRKAGFVPVSRTFRTERDATRWAVAAETEIESGRYFERAEGAKHTLAEAIDRYIANEIPKRSRPAKDAVAQLIWWKQEIGGRKLAELRPSHLATGRDKLLGATTVQGKPRQPATVNRYMAALSHVFTVAMKDWAWLEDSPMRRVRKLKEPRGRLRYLSDEERERLLAKCRASRDPLLYPIVLLALATGMRRGEIL